MMSCDEKEDLERYHAVHLESASNACQRYQTLVVHTVLWECAEIVTELTYGDAIHEKSDVESYEGRFLCVPDE